MYTAGTPCIFNVEEPRVLLIIIKGNLVFYLYTGTSHELGTPLLPPVATPRYTLLFSFSVSHSLAVSLSNSCTHFVAVGSETLSYCSKQNRGL